MRDQAVDFDGIDEAALWRLANPAADGGSRGPTIEGGIELDGFEFFGVVREPFVSGNAGRIEGVAPVPVEPAATADVNLQIWFGTRHQYSIHGSGGGAGQKRWNFA